MKHFQHKKDNKLYNRIPVCGQLTQLYNQLSNNVYSKVSEQLCGRLSHTVYSKVHGNL